MVSDQICIRPQFSWRPRLSRQVSQTGRKQNTIQLRSYEESKLYSHVEGEVKVRGFLQHKYYTHPPASTLVHHKILPAVFQEAKRANANRISPVVSTIDLDGAYFVFVVAGKHCRSKLSCLNSLSRSRDVNAKTPVLVTLLVASCRPLAWKFKSHKTRISLHIYTISIELFRGFT